MARRITGGLVGSSTLVGTIQISPEAILSTAADQDITFSPGAGAQIVATADIQLNAQSDLRFADADSSNFIAIQSPVTVGANYTLTLPSAVAGSNGFALLSDTNGTLSWAAPGLALTDNTSDSGTNFITFATSTSGTLTAARVSSTRLTFQPSTGTLTADGPVVDRRQDNGQSSSYTIALADRNRVVAFNGGGSQTVTIPNESSVDFPIGSVVYIARVGAGSLTLAAAAGVTLSKTGTFAPNEELYIRKRSSNNWIVVDAERDLTATGGTTTTPAGFSLHQFTTTGASTLTVS